MLYMLEVVSSGWASQYAWVWYVDLWMAFLYYLPTLPWNFAILLLRLWASLDLICQKNMAEVLACHFEAWDSKGLVHFHLVSCTIEFPFGTLPHPWEQAWKSLLENESPCGGELWCPTANQFTEAEPTKQNTPELPLMKPKCLTHKKWVK